MPKLKVLQLHGFMKIMIDNPEKHPHEKPVPVPENFPLVGRDGFYCRGEDVWWEYRGKGYLYGRTLKDRAIFDHKLAVNDDAILMQCEAAAMKTILKTTRDAAVKKAVGARLQLHGEALYLRNLRRNTFLSLGRRLKSC